MRNCKWLLHNLTQHSNLACALFHWFLYRSCVRDLMQSLSSSAFVFPTATSQIPPTRDENF